MRDLMDDVLLMLMFFTLAAMFIGFGILGVQCFEQQDCEDLGGEYKRKEPGDLWPECMIRAKEHRR
jgi:hypothetical protein